MEKINLDFRGEFGWELLKAIPYAYYLHTKGLLGTTIGCIDTKCLYYFSENHLEKHEKRCCSGNWEKDWKTIPFNCIHQSKINCKTWIPPPYKEAFRNEIFIYDKPTVIISNKYNQEWGHDPINFIPTEILIEITSILSKNFKIIYNRPSKNIIVEDGPKIYDLDEKNILEKMGVVLMEKIFEQYKSKFTFNQVQMMMFSNCEKFISVQGGTSILSSYFGGINLIFAKKGKEIDSGSYEWYNLLSGCDVRNTNKEEEIIEMTKHLL